MNTGFIIYCFYDLIIVFIIKVSFPFLFGVMFGDVGHGGIVLVAGVALCAMEPMIRHKEEFEQVLRMRYMILLMGFFATYMGFIYNDFMSLPLEFFGKGCYIMKNETFVQ